MTKIEKIVDEMIHDCGDYRGCSHCEYSKICDSLKLMPNNYSTREEIIAELNEEVE